MSVSFGPRKVFAGEGWFDIGGLRDRGVVGEVLLRRRMRWRGGGWFGGGGVDDGGFDGAMIRFRGGRGRGERRRPLGGESVAALGQRTLVGGVAGHSGGRLLVLVGLRRSCRGWAASIMAVMTGF